MKNFKKARIWSIINKFPHPSLPNVVGEENGNITSIIKIMFPGVSYNSIVDIKRFMEIYGRPALQKLFPKLSEMKAKDVDTNSTIRISIFLKSENVRWDNPDKGWEEKYFEKLWA